jgi:hypothetical protein
MISPGIFRNLCLVGLLSCGAVHAQFSIKAGSTNLLDRRMAGASASLSGSAVNAITVRNGGAGYTAAPLVTLSAPPSGSTATATATISSGVVTAITVTSGGSGYTTPPTVTIAPPPPYNPTGTPVVTTPQYAGLANTSAGSASINATALGNTIPGITEGRHPRGYNKSNPSSPTLTVVMARSSFGYSFASGVPRYMFGDEIPRPSVNWKGEPVADSYWRAKPVEPGETFSPAGTSNLGTLGSGNTPIEAGTVTVNSSTAGSTDVTVASVPDTLTPGAILLGEQVAYISGKTVTLVTPTSITTTAATSVSFTPRQSFYYSPHAQRVFASQSGRVTITWVSSLPDTSGTNETTPSYKFRQETFAVASSSRVPVKTIYWTGKGFSSPAVEIPSGRISLVNPIYNSFVPPGVANAYTPVGANPGSVTMPEEHRTLWFDQVGGAKTLHSYNVEGNLLVEYLGPQSGNGTHEFIGADVVQIKSAPEVITVTTSLGDELLPREGSPLAGDETLRPASPVIDPDALLGFYLASDGIPHYFAEKENRNPDRAQISWMQASDAAIHFLAAPASPNLNIAWPKRFCAYILQWPENLADYVPVNVQSEGNSVTNAIQFDASSLPENKYQDCVPQVETEVDASTQRLLVDFSNSSDKTNRTLLKFMAGGGLWYQRLYIQAESVLGKPAVADPDGTGPLTATPAVYTINDMNGDGAADTTLAATVGTRLEPPAGCELAGYVSSGTCYSADAYLNPFEAGFTAAASKAIIPVNATPGANTLKVWWSRKITPPSPKLKPFYVPAVAATYTVSFPTSAQELVIASGKGLENPVLTAEQAAGSLYVQNDSGRIGFNPNEEHALMVGGNVYALRDDLNVTSSDQYSSAPYVLIAYHESAVGRPAMRVAKVVRSNDTYPLSWNKPAGTPVQAPMPLALLPLPLVDENDPYSVKNSEVILVADNATSSTAPVGSSVSVNYNSFTFVDRKGMHWLYRGPHKQGNTPSYGMRYYYKSMPGFFIPGINLESQPAVGTIMPYIAAASGENKVTGLATTLTYYPKWPDDSVFGAQAATVPVLATAQTLMLPTSGLPQVRGQTSAQIAYQQSRANSIANGGTTLDSVVLSDPTRRKTHPLGVPGGLAKLPPSVPVTQSSGRTYFQGLPPHLQNRFYFDPNLGSGGSLVLEGEFVDVPAGEDFLNLNALSEADVDLLHDLCPSTDTANRSQWENAINGLSTRFETFSESATVPGTYVVDKSKDSRSFDKSTLPDVISPDTAVDSYALSSTGEGSGYVTLVFGNGEAFTDAGDPVVMQVIKVGTQLHQGDLKALLSSNPLDEQVTLRHSGDYGGEPGNFEFQWRYGFPVNGSYPTQSNGVTAKAIAKLGVWPTNFSSINSGTNRYSSAPTVTISGGGGSGATAIARLGLSPSSFTITPGTQTYSVAPTVTITGGNVTATAQMGLTAASFTITSNTQRYSVAPTVTISGGGGTGATATANLTSGAVTSVTITNPGSGYTSAPTIAFSGGTISTAGTVPTGTGNATRFIVTGVAITNISGNATSAPSITFSGGTVTTAGTPPTGVGNASNFVVYSIGMTNTGTGYTTAPSISFSGGTITFAGTAPSATGNATGFVVSEVVVTEPGTQYSNAPAVTFSGGGGSGATATAVLNATQGVESITVTAGYGGYSSPPTVTLEAPIAPINTSAATASWLKPNGTLGSSIIVGGSPAAALSDPAILMGDCYFTMAYRRKADPVTGAAAGEWSNWTSPVLVEGWIKRVLAKITPFNQRMTDLSTSAINTDVSMLTQAGTRWEGDIALNLDNINDVGLIAIYETILNRGKSFTVGNGIDFSTTNDALLLAAGYLNDLYVILGNEAYADAANPTISIDDQATATEVNTSRFSFEGQVASSLDEELALLRGRDDLSSPGTGVAPSYNRLFWNYTRGINSGEALYATNYNIKEKTGSPSANGILDAADAQRMFPQGHGDAYGHYLTAVTNYYKLLTHPYFTWIPRAEAVTVLGQTVLVDYKDERKFAAAAVNVAKTAQQILSLVHRKSYTDDTSIGWANLRDKAVSPATGESRHWGLDEWTSRSAQGSFLHWVTGNSLLPSEDKLNNGVRKIDRTTVPELDQLVTAAYGFQTTIDNANARLNPLGLSPEAIAFDISPAELKNGRSHYEQIGDRALTAVLNARGAFTQAAKMTRLLRNQENQVTEKNTAIEDQEAAYEGQLIEIYGQPYAGDTGPGRTYPQGYSGPDLLNWSIVDRPSTLFVNPESAVTVNLRAATGAPNFGSLSVDQIRKDYAGNSTPSTPTVARTLRILPSSYAQFSDIVSPGSSLGARPQSGQLQQALLDAEVARAALHEANFQLQALQGRFSREGELILEMVAKNKEKVVIQNAASATIAAANLASSALKAVAQAAEDAADAAEETAAATSQVPPTVIGLANDATSGIRGALRLAGIFLSAVSDAVKRNAAFTADVLDATYEAVVVGLEGAQMELDFTQEEKQAIYEYKQTYHELLAQVYTFNSLSANLQTADQNVRNLLATAQSILADRESFRQRAAAVISGYRTNDLTFRTFRDESLEEYRSLYDLAGRYTYLAAKSYDYETGLLGTPEGRSVIAAIVASRALGDLSGDIPRATTSSLGDSGLAGSLARLNADFSVVKGRLGINNPDQYGTLFSLRGELYRIGSSTTSDKESWQQTLEQSIKPDLMADPDVVRYCNNLRKPDGSPVPGFLIPFSTTIQHGRNFFGLPVAAGDHAYSPGSYSTKISSAGIVLKGYVGMDPYSEGNPGAGSPNTTDPNSLSATPYVYLIPCGQDSMLAPPLGDTNTLRSWTVHDQALPLPFNLGASAFNATQLFNAASTLSEQAWIQRKHQGFRPVSDPAFFYSSVPGEFTNSRLVGRSVWNSKWKIVIPAYTLLSDEQAGMNRFTSSVQDIQLFLRTYSHSGN